MWPVSTVVSTVWYPLQQFILDIRVFLHDFIWTWTLSWSYFFLLHFTSLSARVNPFYVAKNGRIFPWAEFSDSIYYSALAGLCSDMAEVVCTLQVVVKLLKLPGYYGGGTASYRCLILLSAEYKPKDQTGWIYGYTAHQGSEIRLRYPMLFVYSLWLMILGLQAWTAPGEDLATLQRLPHTIKETPNHVRLFIIISSKRIQSRFPASCKRLKSCVLAETSLRWA